MEKKNLINFAYQYRKENTLSQKKWEGIVDFVTWVTEPQIEIDKFPKNCCYCPVDMDEYEGGCDHQYASTQCCKRVNKQLHQKHYP